METAIDPGRVEAFAERLLGVYTGGMLTLMIAIGHQTGLFEAAADGPATSAELAERAGLDERYVREWLGAVTTGRLLTYDPQTGVFELPGEHAALLTGSTSMNIAPLAGLVPSFSRRLEAVSTCFREGGGVPYAEFRPDFTELMDGLSRGKYDDHLLDGYLAAAPDVIDRLQRGARVADIGCGTGHAVNLMARAFPRSSFIGFDISEEAIARATVEAAAWGLTNARFEVFDVARLPAEPPFDLVTAFDAIHDQADPAGVLRRVREALAPGGVFLMVDVDASSRLEENLERPLAPFLYSVSVLHCMTVSLAEGGAGLGTCWGEQVARRMLGEAGFGEVRVSPAPPPDQVNAIYVCRSL